MTRKLLVAALSLLIILTFFIQQKTYALYVEDGGIWDEGIKWKTFNTVLNDYPEDYKYYKLTKNGTLGDKTEIRGEIIHYVWTYSLNEINDGLLIETLLYVPSEPLEDEVSYFYNIDTGNHIDGWCLNKDNVTSGKYHKLYSAGDSYPVGTNPIVEGNYIYVECKNQEEFKKKHDDLINKGTPPDNGKEGTLGENGFEHSKIKYDLEVPLGFDSNTSQNHKYGLFANTGMFDSDKQDYTFKWYQSDNVTKLPSYSDWELQFEISGFGNFRKILTPWDVTKFETPFLFLESIPNFRNTYSTKFEDWSEIVESYLSNEYDIPIDGGGYAYAYNTPNFRLRNVWNDNEKGITHYSNWILIQCKKDGTYTVTEVNSKDIEKDNVKTDDLVDNKKTDSIYDGVSNDDLADNGKESFFGNVKSFLNSIGYVPEFFTKIFSFLPDWCLTFVGFGFTIIVAIGVYKMVRG